MATPILTSDNLLSHSQVLDSPYESVGVFYVIVMQLVFYNSFQLSTLIYAFGGSLAVYMWLDIFFVRHSACKDAAQAGSPWANVVFRNCDAPFYRLLWTAIGQDRLAVAPTFAPIVLAAHWREATSGHDALVISALHSEPVHPHNPLPPPPTCVTAAHPPDY